MRWEQDPWAAPGTGRRRGSGGQDWHVGRNRIFAVLGACVALYAVWSLVGGEHGVLTLHRLARHEAELKAEIAASRERVATLDDQVRHIDRTREMEARLKYGMARDDEMIYQSVPRDSAGTAAGGAAPSGVRP